MARETPKTSGRAKRQRRENPGFIMSSGYEVKEEI
jgi:hypothetical protein